MLFSLRSKQYKPVIVRAFRSGDAPLLSAIIHKNDKTTKSESHLHGIPRAASDDVPDIMSNLAKDKEIFVPVFDDKPVGMACVKGDIISPIFIDPGLRRRGVGRMLVEHIESKLAEKGHRTTQVYATPYEKSFYKRLGYEEIKEVRDDKGAEVTLMTKGFTIT
jgi:GNAT superfamily N-acetyltransferase